MLQKLKNKKGFTLVEMIVVIAIIAILIGLIAPNVVKLIKNATNTANDATAKTIEGSANAWGTELYTLGAKFDVGANGMNASTVPNTTYSYYLFEVNASTDNSYGTPDFDACFDFTGITSFDPAKNGGLIGTGDMDTIKTKDLKIGWSYYIYFTEVGTCGGVVVTNANDKIVGFTKNLPTGVVVERDADIASATL